MGFKSFLEELIIDYIKTIDPNFKDDSKSRGNKNDNSFTLGKEGNNQTKKRRCC